MKVDHFTYTDLAKAGPLFHPESGIRARALDALRLQQLAKRVLDKRVELHNELTQAKLHLRLRQRILYDARNGMKIATRECEVEVGHALDRVWAAQRGVAMWDHVYGELL